MPNNNILPSVEETIVELGDELQSIPVNMAGGPWPPASLKPKKKRKNYSASSNDSIDEIFGCETPPIISPIEAQRFVELQGLVCPRPFPLSSPKTLLGIEVEVENVLRIDPNATIMFWLAKDDHSLRNYGKEFVTPGVIPASMAEPALRQLFACLNSDIDFSQRTSIHVHLDVRQLTLQQMVSLLLVYTTVENLLFKFVGNNRRTNIFCVPITETGIMEAMSLDPKKFIHTVDTSWQKYTALNLLPIINQGSIEFRHLPGTANITLLLAWVDMLCRLKTYVYRMPYDSIVAEIQELNSNSMYKQYVDRIFGEMTTYLDTTNLLVDMEKPVYLAKNCSIANPFDTMVHSSNVTDSTLGSKLGMWCKGFSKEQMEAIAICARDLVGQSDLEEAFSYLVSKSSYLIQHYPKWEKVILQAISSKPVETKKIEIEKLMQGNLNFFSQQWLDQVNNPHNHEGNNF